MRNFYAGSAGFRSDSLVYDGLGHISGNHAAGDWTLDGAIEVEQLHVSNRRLVIDAKRLTVAWSSQEGLQFQVTDKKNESNRKKGTPLTIRIEFGSAAVTADSANAALSQVFLTAQDRFIGLVPDYWSACVTTAVTGRNAEQLRACHFAPEFLAIPGVAMPMEQNSKPPSLAGAEKFTAAELQIVQHKNDLSPPRAINTPNPSYSEEARSAHVSGSVGLILMVDKAGKPRNIQIVKPLGYGLDRRAVETAATWEFTPAMEQGQPVDHEIALDVSFNIF